MPRNILIIGVDLKNALALNDLFTSLTQTDWTLIFNSSQTEMKDFCKEKKYACIRSLLLAQKAKLSYPLSLLFLPFLWAGAFFSLLLFKFKHRINAIICLGQTEKILITPWALLFGIKIIWLECPGQNTETTGKIARFLMKRFHSSVRIAAFDSKTKNRLTKAGWQMEKIRLIRPGINHEQRLRQENIFHDLAHTRNSSQKNNFFTIGTIADLDKEQEVEIILGAAKKALNVIPNLQIIIIGDGADKKNLNWLAKKMDLGNLVWFVGRQTHLHKWLDSFNIFITAAKDATLADIKALLHALSSGIPAIAPQNRGFDDVILDNTNGLLIESFDSDLIANAIIRLHQDQGLAKKLGQNAKKDISEKFTDKNMAADFIETIQ